MKIQSLKKKICSIKIQTFQFGVLKKIINILTIFEKKKLNDSLLIEYKTLPLKIKKFTVQRSPHVFKKAREQFELRTNTYVISIESLISQDEEKVEARVRYILNNLLLKLMQIHGISIQVNSVFFKNFKKPKIKASALV